MSKEKPCSLCGDREFLNEDGICMKCEEQVMLDTGTFSSREGEESD